MSGLKDPIRLILWRLPPYVVTVGRKGDYIGERSEYISGVYSDNCKVLSGQSLADVLKRVAVKRKKVQSELNERKF